MARTWIKICGIRDAETARAAAEAGADAVGVAFVERSPRVVTPAQACDVVEALPPGVEPIGLFVDHAVQDVQRIARAVGLGTVQLHGRETPHDVRSLVPLRVIKALPFDPANVSAALRSWRDPPANLWAIMLDAPAGADALPGGHGRAFAWPELRQAVAARWFDGLPPIILAGGLTPDNVADAVRTVRPFGVDVSSGVESSRGVKSADLIRRFCAAVRALDG